MHYHYSCNHSGVLIDHPQHLQDTGKCTLLCLHAIIVQLNGITVMVAREKQRYAHNIQCKCVVMIKNKHAGGVPGAGHHKVPTSELSASAIFRRSSKQRDECLSPMGADEI